MKNILLSILFLGIGSVSFAQADGPVTPKIPEVTLPSPSAYALTKYGDIPINEFTGMVNATIPIYTLKAGKLDLPIILNYSASGVKVAQPATWTGINWTLNAGGVITRTIDDAPDESISAYNRLTAEMIDPTQLINGSAHAAFLNGVFIGARKNYDFKPDIFSFSFGNYSGTFFMDANFVPRLSKADSNLKIEIVGNETDLKQRFRNSQEFCITTPDGVKYYFGGPDATESSFMGSHRDNPYANTGFYLNRIYHPDFGAILFEYTSETLNSEIWSSQSESITILKYEDTHFTVCKRPPTTEGEHTINVTNNVTKNGKFLSKIKGANNYTEIVFNSSAGSKKHYTRILNTIEVFDGGVSIQKVDLSYLFPQTPTTSERFFLTKVEFNKDKNYGTGRKYEQYTMDYNTPLDLPGRKSESKDLAGYYNGKPNSTALPQNFDIDFENYYPNLADRSSYFTYAVKGSLKKITYPTGGYTAFEYESPKAKEYDKETKSLTIWRNDTGRIPVSKTAMTVPLGSPYTTATGQFSFTDAVMDEEVTVRIDLTANAQMGHTDRILFKLIDNTTNTSQVITIIMPDGSMEIGTGNFTYSRDFTINLIKGHIYDVELSNTYSSVVKFEATAAFSYTKGFKKIDQPGIRVGRVTDFTAETQNAFVKRYYYNSAKDFLINPYDLLSFRKNFSFVTDINLLKCCNPIVSGNPLETQGILTEGSEIRLRTLSSSAPYTDVIDTKYEYVTISYGGDNFELGGTEKYFSKIPVGTMADIHGLATSPFQTEKAMYNGNLEGIYHGTLLQETDLIRKKDELFKIKQQIYNYTYDDLANISGVTGGYAKYNCTYPTSGADNLDIGMYRIYSKKVSLIGKETKEYIDPLPITLQAINESNYKTVTTTQEYNYGALIGLPTVIKTTTSEENITKEIHNIYANQPNVMPGLTAGQITALNKLVALNKVAVPVMVKTFRNVNSVIPENTSTQLTLYKSWNNNPNLILPEIIRTSIGNGTLEDRVIIEAYDNNANMTLAAMKNGPKTRYSYNGFNQVLLKIDNYTGGDDGSGGNGEITFPEPTPGTPCTMSQIYPGGMATLYYYNNVTHLLIRKVDPNCRNTYYEYDALNRLKRIKDHDGNSIEEYDNNYKIN